MAIATSNIIIPITIHVIGLVKKATIAGSKVPVMNKRAAARNCFTAIKNFLAMDIIPLAAHLNPAIKARYALLRNTPTHFVKDLIAFQRAAAAVLKA